MNTLAQDRYSPHRLGDLIADIERSHHAFARNELERIAGLFDALTDAGTPAPLELWRCFTMLRADLLPHLMKEESILFPYITALESDPVHPPPSCFGSVTNPIRMMKIEHDHVKILLLRLHELTSNFEAMGDDRTDALYSAMKGLDRDLQEHIQREDDELFPAALQLEREMAS